MGGRAGRSRSRTSSPTCPAAPGKGNALWKSLYVSNGDLVCWLDADIWNFGSHFVTRLLEPLLDRPRHRVREGLLPPAAVRRAPRRRPGHRARWPGPCSSALFPHLTGFVQPLAGEYAGRRELLEAVPFVEGWGVEIGLAHRPRRAVRHRRPRPGRPRSARAPQPAARRARAAGDGGAAHRCCAAPASPTTSCRPRSCATTSNHEVESIAVETRERPPMLDVPAYRAKFGRELSA